jgi:hypothetical protein
MAGQSVQQLKQLVADARPTPGFPTLPKTMWDSASGKHIAVDSAYLRSRDAWELKRLLRLYGEQVNQRLAGN